jgi:hypothetical protein
MFHSTDGTWVGRPVFLWFCPLSRSELERQRLRPAAPALNRSETLTGFRLPQEQQKSDVMPAALLVSRQRHVEQSVRVRLVVRRRGEEKRAGETPPTTGAKGAWAHTRLQRTANTEVASSHASPVAEKAHNARKQQELAETSPTRTFHRGVSASTRREQDMSPGEAPRRGGENLFTR